MSLNDELQIDSSLAMQHTIAFLHKGLGTLLIFDIYLKRACARARTRTRASISSISAYEDNSRFPRAGCLRRSELANRIPHIPQICRRWDAQYETWRVWSSATPRGVRAIEMTAREVCSRWGLRKTGGRKAVGDDRRMCWNARAKKPRSHSISVADFAGTHPERRPTMESLLSTGKRISLLNVNRLETIDAFTGLSDFPLCSRAVPRALAILIRLYNDIAMIYSREQV